MNTKGAYGYRINSTDKITYNELSSHPSHLGRKILTYIAITPVEQMRKAARNIELVDFYSKPLRELIEKYKEYSDEDARDNENDDWYSLLYKSQGNCQEYHHGLKHMIDCQFFLMDSLVCEWAFIINLDEEVFEAYRGINKDTNAPGRYASRKTWPHSEYSGVRLFDEIDLKEIRLGAIGSSVKRLEQNSRK